MITITPIKSGYVPLNNDVAKKIVGPNYDEFQSDIEIFNILKHNRDNILSVSMAHCDVEKESLIMEDGSDVALDHALANFNKLISSGKLKNVRNFLWVYEITSHRDPSLLQIGLGCMARTDEIRTDKNPKGSILRNEEVYQNKVEGRAKLIKKLGAFDGIVNNAVEDKNNIFLSALNSYKELREADITVLDEQNNIHRVWIVTEKDKIDNFVSILKKEEYAFVADGNHRSAAAALLGYERFLTVFFPVSRMGLLSYNRLVNPDINFSMEEFVNKLSKYFDVKYLDKDPVSSPKDIHNIYIYTDKKWLHLICKMDMIKPESIQEEIDSDIVQKKIYQEIFNIHNTKDKRINYVGGNRDISYLKSRVDNGEFKYAFVLSPVKMSQFIEVSKKKLFMPPKSTWFDPKIRIGLVIAMVE